MDLSGTLPERQPVGKVVRIQDSDFKVVSGAEIQESVISTIPPQRNKSDENYLTSNHVHMM